MTAIGSIYVSVKGDDTQFKKDMSALRSTASKSGKDVADALNSAISAKKASAGITALSTNLKQLAQTAKVPEGQFKASASAISKSMKKVAAEVGMTDKQFAQLNERMLRNQAYKTAEASLRNIARTADLSGKEIRQLALQMGYSSKEARKMEQSITRAGRGMGKVFSSFKTLLPVLSGAVIVRGVQQFTQATLDMADKIAKTADKIGLSTDALQQYRYAAERSGVATTALDMGMQRFTRRLAEAAQGGGELKGILEQYNIAVRDANGNMRSTDDILDDLADSIQTAESDSERLRIAFKAFDSEGAALVNMLKNGRDGLNVFRQAATRLGVVIDEDLLRNAEGAKDALDDLGIVIRTSFNRAVLELAPGLGQVATDMAEWVADNNTFITQDMPNAMLEFARAVDKVTGGFSNLAEAARKAYLFTTALINPAGVAKELLSMFGEDLRKPRVIGSGKIPPEVPKEPPQPQPPPSFSENYEQILNELIEKQSDYEFEIRQLDLDTWEQKEAEINRWQDVYKANLKKLEDEGKISSQERLALEDEVNQTARAQMAISVRERLKLIEDGLAEEERLRQEQVANIEHELMSEEDRIMESYERRKAIIEANVVDHEKAAVLVSKLWDEAYQAIDGYVVDGTDSMVNMAMRLEEALENPDSFFGPLEASADETFGEKMKNAVTGWASTFSSSLNEMVWNAEISFDEIAQAFAKMITQMVIQQAIVEPILSSIIKSEKGNVFGPAGVQRFARGGVVTQPTVFPFANGVGLMGEAGPEAVMPLKRTPSGDLGVQATGTGSNVYVQIENNTGADVSTRQTKKGGDDVIQVIIGRVNESIRSGTSGRAIADTFGLRRAGTIRG